jgi:hypothetical protein
MATSVTPQSALQTITVPGMGDVDFPASMQDADIKSAIKRNLAKPPQQPPAAQAPAPPPTPVPAKLTDGSTINVAAHPQSQGHGPDYHNWDTTFGNLPEVQAITGVAKGIRDLFSGVRTPRLPLNTPLEQSLQAANAQSERATTFQPLVDAARQQEAMGNTFAGQPGLGNKAEALGHYLGEIPMVGPAFSTAFLKNPPGTPQPSLEQRFEAGTGLAAAALPELLHG